MRTLRRNRSAGFTLVELLVVVLILQILAVVALPAYLTAAKEARTKTANSNARAIASTVKANWMRLGATNYTSVITSTGSDVTGNLAKDLGGSIPSNPCTGGKVLGTDYTITSATTTCTIKAVTSGSCNATTTFTLSG
ncbi:MAG: prepilin-type N-terminal cleavage/methylation domain-containing protein [Armatimonadetes bacterium]|nr:prepilin-type N-terminal cleavage/methylation domain-containing protein [Armatimonadota bacterium]